MLHSWYPETSLGFHNRTAQTRHDDERRRLDRNHCLSSTVLGGRIGKTLIASV
ncbi:hypothetical protein PMIN01_02767 [Paraphaeosphaeria minitans]|uniref:Uncharacterized protein n=1 Tax=Paraphaeosphaeria minitans TaxID=565426 RepID=A0A9P6GQQ2_9PLEO|nr:hypothetical protein PMIN01_02767 [Paraphaeosphaeria minitans]